MFSGDYTMIMAEKRKVINDNNISINGWFVFIVICFIYAILGLITHKYILTDNLYYHSLSERLSYNQIHSILHLQHKFEWLGYAIIPLVILLKEGYAALAITTGFILFGVYTNYRTVFKAALVGEFVFLFEGIYKLIGLLWFVNVKTTTDIAEFSPLSMLEIFNDHKIVPWLIYPLHTLNLFELFYCLIVAWILSIKLKEKYTDTLANVIISYGAGMILLIVTIMFLSLQLSS